MHNIWTLLKCRVVNDFKLNYLRKGQGTKHRGNFFLMFISLIVLGFVGAFYALMVSFGLVQIGITWLIPIFASMLACLFIFFLSLFRTYGELFYYGDYNLLSSLPISMKELVSSRIGFMYIYGLLVALIIFLPPLLFYAVISGKVILLFVPILLSTFVLPVLPIMFAGLVSWLIAFISGKFQQKKAIMMILNILVLFSILVGPSFFRKPVQFGLEKGLENLNVIELKEMFNQILAEEPFVMFLKKVTTNGVYWGLWILCSLVVAYLIITLISKNYRRIVASLLPNTKNKTANIAKIAVHSPVFAIMEKEFRRLFSSSIYIINMTFGIIIAVLFAVTYGFLGISTQILNFGVQQGMQNQLLPFMLAALLNASATTCVSLSLEGKTVWLMQTMPLSERMIYRGKILMNILLVSPFGILCSLLILVKTPMSFMEIIWLIVTPITFAVCMSYFGMLTNKVFHSFDWESENQVIKQSIKPLFVMLWALIGNGIPALCVFFWHSAVIPLIANIIFLLIAWLIDRSFRGKQLLLL